MILASLVLGFAIASAGEEVMALRYDLTTGDHLVYRQTLRREGKGPETEFETRAEWTSHVVVTGQEGGRLVVGFQRNRTSFELVSYREKGRDRLERERPGFTARQPPPRLAEANLLNDRGEPGRPWSALREATSEMLPALHEIEVLPSAPVKAGDTWQGAGMQGLTFRAAAWEDVHGRRALRVDGASANGTATLRYWYGPESGVVERLDFEGSYETIGFNLHETLSMGLVERRRGEDLPAWAVDPEVRQGAFAALLAAEASPLDPAWLHGLLKTDDGAFRRQVLALLYRRGLPPPPVETLSAILGGDDPRTRVLAVRLLEHVDPPLARPLLDRALADGDAFVRAAAKAWTVPRDGASADAPTPRFPREPPATTLRPMTAAGFEGWPYVVHVPEDYRGDQPFPLLIWLSGGPGRALLGLPGARDVIGRLGYLVVFPQAADLWWTAASTAVVNALRDEVMRRFNVDANRVYMSGASNGGTGAYWYATFWPQRFAAVVSLMGAGPFVGHTTETPLAANLEGLPILFAHGDKDEIIPMDASEKTAAEVRREAPHAKVELKILTGRGHDIFLGTDDGLIAGFIERYVRDPFPRRVKLAMRDVVYPRRAWVEVLLKKEGVAEAEGEIGPDNGIRLKTRNVERLRLLLRRELLPAPGPFRVTWNGKAVFEGPFAEDLDLLARTARASADPYLGWSMELPLAGQ
jgi:hypothetical protein